jgi:flagellar protein FliO/FliZ
MIRLLMLLVGWFVALAVSADEVSAPLRQTTKSVASVDVLQWSLALLAVLVIFFAVIWLLRKSGSLGLINKGELAIVTGLPLSMREKLVLVRVGEKQLLLGVSAGRIDKLLELEGDQRLFQNQGAEREAGLFAKKLMQVMQGKGDV